jgi:uncharacterized protein (TIGR02145 family)
MRLKSKLFILTGFSAVFLLLAGCSEKFGYLDDYEGSWQFRVAKSYWSRPDIVKSPLDTIYYLGTISKLSDNRGIRIYFLDNTSISTWVEDETIIYKGSTLGLINEDEVRFGYTIGSLAYGSTYSIFGVRKKDQSGLDKTSVAVTNSASGVTITGAFLRGTINAGSSYCEEIEFEYGTSENYGTVVKSNPDKANCNMDISCKGYVSGLNPSTTYHFRIKARCPEGNLYGNDMTFKTSEYSEQVTDVEGNVYNTVKIGSQVWMTENLKTTKYQNGEDIPNLPLNVSYTGLTQGAFCYYRYDDVINKSIFGPLYNYYAVSDNRDLCPSGWHIPRTDEWTLLNNYLNPNSADRMKSTSLWTISKSSVDNSSGFNALPGGYLREVNLFAGIGYSGSWWIKPANTNSFVANVFSLSNYNFGVIIAYDKQNFFSVRCIKD